MMPIATTNTAANDADQTRLSAPKTTPNVPRMTHATESIHAAIRSLELSSPRRIIVDAVLRYCRSALGWAALHVALDTSGGDVDELALDEIEAAFEHLGVLRRRRRSAASPGWAAPHVQCLSLRILGAHLDPPCTANTAASSRGWRAKTACSEAISMGSTPRRAAISRCFAGGMILSSVQST